jgi:hypothetical protein
MMVTENWKPDIPNVVLPETKELICDCLLKKDGNRPSFSDIFDRIEKMQFKLMKRLNSSKLVEFVQEIRALEAANLTE